MLTLKITHYETRKATSLSLRGEGTVINTQVLEDNVRHVARYIKFYEPDKIECSNVSFGKRVQEQLLIMEED